MRKFLAVLGILVLAFSMTALAAKKKPEKPADRSIMHNNLGVTALYEGDVERAIFEFKTATELSPKYIEAWNNLGLGYKTKGNMDLAIQCLQKSISLDHKYASPHNHLGSVYYDQGRYDEALKEFDEAIKLNKLFSDAYYNKGLTFTAMAKKTGDKTKLKEAEEVLVKATTINPEHPYAHNDLARLYQDRGDFEKAIIRYKLALEISPNLTDSWINLATLYNQTGETLKAQQALAHAMENDPDSPYAHMNMGLGYLREKNFLLALKEFDVVISKMPTNDLAYFNAGLTHFNLGIEARNKGDGSKADIEFGETVKAYQSALILKPNSVDAAYNVAYAYHIWGKRNEAQTGYQKTLAIQPEYAKALYMLGIWYQEGGDLKNAAANLCRVAKIKSADIPVTPEQLKKQIDSLGGCS